MATVRGSFSGPRTGLTRTELRLILDNQARGHNTILGTFLSGEQFDMRTGPRRIVNIEPWFGRMTWVAASGDRAVVASNDTYELLVYSAAGQLEMIIRKQHTHLQVTPDDLAAWKRQFDYPSDANRRRLYLRVFREMPVPATMPAYGARYWGGYPMNPIVPDALGNLWVREYTRLSDPSSRWTVFDHEGYWFGTVRLPDGLAPFDIGNDYVLGVWRDADDVIWHRKSETGFCTIPRTLSLAATLIKHLGNRIDASRVFIDLWTRNFDDGLVVINDPEAMAASCGYARGGRGVRTWRQAIHLLEELGFIRLEAKGTRTYGYVLLLHPNDAVERLREKGVVPDWCEVDDHDRLRPRPGSSASFGWSAVRVPIRIAWDISGLTVGKREVFSTRV
ncbi:MAG: hypothetical protein IID49_06865 [Proteobacteria bacterium]|nr:hypothetical protein [Pseudomonadota bacterium]